MKTLTLLFCFLLVFSCGEDEKDYKKKMQEAKQEIKSALSEAKKEIQKAIEGIKKQKTGLIKTIRGIDLKKTLKKKKLPVKETPEVKIETPPKREVILSKPKKKFNEVEFIKRRIHDAREALRESDLKRARHIYVEIMASYNELKEKE